MQVKEFINAFVPEWNTEFNFRAKTIKSLYPDVFKNTGKENAWLSPEDLLFFEDKLTEPQFENYTATWKRLHKNHWDEVAANQKEEEQPTFNIQDGVMINPIDKIKYTFEDTQRLSPGGFRKSIFMTGSIHNLIDLSDTIHGIFVNYNNAVDIALHSPNDIKTHGYTSLHGNILFLKFPLDHMICNKASKYGIRISIWAHMLEKQGFRIRNLMFIHKNKAIVTHYKKWEVEKMAKYHGVMKKIDYSSQIRSI